jgi:hypothetical protein
MKSGFAGVLVVFSMLAAPQVLTNQTVEAMVYGGVPLATIVSAIKGAAKIQLSETKQDYDSACFRGEFAGGSDGNHEGHPLPAVQRRRQVARTGDRGTRSVGGGPDA